MSALLPTARAGALWSHRARAELDAAARFGSVAEGLAALGTPRPIIDLARRAVEDEQRHHLRCAELARCFDTDPGPAPVVHAPSLDVGSNDLRARVLHELVAMSCITETLSTALLIEMRARATDPLVRDVVHHVLRDEVDHARLGWAYLEAGVDPSLLARVSERLPGMLRDTASEELFSDAPDPPGATTLAGLGGLPRSTRCQIFASTMREVVFPGLQRHGLDTWPAQRWLDARVPARSP